MPAIKRTSAAGMTSDGSSKKRRTGGKEPKYYGVRAGRNPGVYTVWAECQEQISGFSGAQFKSFPTQEEAEDFVAGKNPVSPTEPDKFYAVAVGNPPGIYTVWTQAQEAITGVSGPKYKRFTTRADAEAYIEQYAHSADPKSPSAKELSTQTVAQPTPETAAAVQETTPKVSRAGKIKAEANDISHSINTVSVWTDGSSLGNGRVGAAAGVGVWFKQGDSRNISEVLPGEVQTNQRAELMAMLRALQIVDGDQHILIHSDSKYAIDCVTQWAAGWATKGWKTREGKDVMNQDLIRGILAIIAEREKAGGRTDFKWVQGHSDDVGNTHADRLAVAGAKKLLRERAAAKTAAPPPPPQTQTKKAEEEEEDDDDVAEYEEEGDVPGRVYVF